MSIILNLRQALIVDDGVNPPCTRIGNPNVDQTLTDLTNGTAGVVEDVLVTDAFGVATLWVTPQAGITTYEKAYIFSDVDLAVEIRTDNGTPEFILMFIEANTLTPLPALLGGNTTESIDGAILVQGTDYDNADQIRVQRDVAAAIGDATVTLYLFT